MVDEFAAEQNALDYRGEVITDPSISFAVGAPEGLTKGGRPHKLRQDSIQKIYENVKAAVDFRVNTLKEEVLAAYTRRSSGETYRSIQSNVSVTEDGVIGDFSVNSPAVPFITAFGGGRPLSAMDIFPVESERLVFIGREGKRVSVPMVHHPGFDFIGDPINLAAQALQEEVRQAVLDAVKESTITWADEMSNESVKNLRRQYRYSSPAGR